MTDPVEQFQQEVLANIEGLRQDIALRALSAQWMTDITARRYAYNFRWLGRPIIQIPQDMVAVQELVWATRPDLIIETGIAHGGSLVLSASLLALLDYCDAAEAGTTIDPRQPRRRVLGIDIDIRAHNRAALESHPLRHRMEMIQGSSIDPSVVAQVQARAQDFQRVMICLDSNHTHDHVLNELEAYAPLTTRGSYCCVFDTVIEDMPDGLFADRPWGRGDNAKTALHEYLRRLREEGRTAADGQPLQLEVDHHVDDKLLLTVAPDGYLRRP